MKEITKERTQKYTIYQAVDGTEFGDKAECEKYERSAEGVLQGKFSKLIVNRQNAWDLLKGYDDNDVVALKLSTLEDIDTVLQLYYLQNPHILEEKYKDRRQQYIELAHRALKEKDLLLMGINCDDDFYFMDTRNDIIENLKELDKEELKNDTER